MRKKNTKNILFMLGGGFVSKLIPSQNMHKVGQTPSGVGIYTASADVLRTYYPDLYAQRPGAKGYIFTGNGTTFTPSKSGAKGIDNYIDIELLKKYTPGYTSNGQNQSNRNTTDNVDNNIYTGPEGDEVVVTPEKNGTINDYGDNLSTWGNGPAASAYDPNSELVRPNIERLLYWDPVNKQIRDKQLSERLSSYTPYNFLSTIIPAHLADPMNYLGAAGEYFRGNDNFFLNALSGNNNGIFSLSQDLENWSKEHPNWATAANLAGSAITGKFMLKIPKLFPKVKGAFNTGLNKFSTGLDRAGSWNVKASDWATRSTSALGNRAVSAIESVPGGSSITGLGRGALNTGRSALNSARSYGNRALQYIPNGIRQWTSNAWNNARNVATSFKLENIMDRGLQHVNNGVGLSDAGKLGVKLGKTVWGIGSTAYGLSTGDENANWTKFGNVTKYVAGLTPLYNASNWYGKFLAAKKAVDNAENMFSEGVTPENALNVVEGTIDTLSKNG